MSNITPYMVINEVKKNYYATRNILVETLRMEAYFKVINDEYK